MRKLTKLLSALIVLVLATAFIGCGNPSSSSDGTSGGSGSSGGNSNSPTYTTVAGGTYIDSSTNCGWIFYENYSVSQRTRQGVEITGDAKWRIVNDYTVEIYEELSAEEEDMGMDDVIYTFTANSDFTQLTASQHLSGVFIRQ